MKNLYLITYESSHWCGASGTKVVVWANSPKHAIDEADEHMYSEMIELFSDEYEEEGDDYDAECPYVVNSVDEFGPEHEEWAFYVKDKTYYPEIGVSS